jgi:hypothetical protein
MQLIKIGVELELMEGVIVSDSKVVQVMSNEVTPYSRIFGESWSIFYQLLQKKA